VGGSELRSYFFRLSTKVEQITSVCGHIAVCNAVFPIYDNVLQFQDICNKVMKS